MATADLSSTATASPRASLLTASVLGAAVVVAGVAVAAYVVPQVWDQSVAPALAGAGPMASGFLRVLVQLAALGGFVALGSALAGAHPPKGIRGGIFLVISALITVFFITRAVGLNLEESSLNAYALPATVVVLGGLLGLTFRLLASDRGLDTMRTIDEQGLLGTFNHKRTQGLKARRYTLIGFLLVGLSGVYSLVSHNMLTGDWTLRMPFARPGADQFVALADLAFTAPILLAAVTFWLAWRAVNAPAFADFLIATEAEMNKVSWSSRKRLVQDTIVVLVTLLLMTTFFLVVDSFWGWLLSREQVGVLPTKSQMTVKGNVDSSGARQVEW